MSNRLIERSISHTDDVADGAIRRVLEAATVTDGGTRVVEYSALLLAVAEHLDGTLQASTGIVVSDLPGDAESVFRAHAPRVAELFRVASRGDAIELPE